MKSVAELEREALVKKANELAAEVVAEPGSFRKYFKRMAEVSAELKAFNAANPDLAISDEEACP